MSCLYMSCLQRASFTHAWPPPALHAAALPPLRAPHLAVSVQAAASRPSLRQTLSLRVLTPGGWGARLLSSAAALCYLLSAVSV
jgi:hypothetical protein